MGNLLFKNYKITLNMFNLKANLKQEIQLDFNNKIRIEDSSIEYFAIVVYLKCKKKSKNMYYCNYII